MADASYTAMSNEGFDAIASRAPEHYDMSLNPTDFAMLLNVFEAAYKSGWLSQTEEEWLTGFVSSIGETLGVEFI